MLNAIIGISLLLTAIGFVVTEKNAKYLLAGYNTMSKEDRAKIDLKSYLRTFKRFHIFLGVSLLAEIVVHNLRDYSTHRQKSVDDYPYGGGSGMVMSIEPFAACIEKLKLERDYDEVIFLTPDGETLKQTIANELSSKKNIILLCGHYKGIDQRIRDLFVTREISIGDYVLSGGELPAAVLVDAVVRLLPGVLSDETSALSDSFQGELLDAPVYTRPADWKGHKVPDVLLSGHEAKIAEWRHDEALNRTKQRRPDLLE